MTGKACAAVVSLIGLGALGFGQAPSDIDRKREKRQVQRLEHEAERLDLEAAHAEDNSRVFQTLSKELDVPVETLKAQQRRTDFSFGTLFVANAFAKTTGKTFDEVALKLRKGKGYGEIAHENNTKLSEIISEMRHSTAEMRRAHEEEMAHRRTAGQPDQTSRSAAAEDQGSSIRKSRRRGQ